jgi:hypothetical protein
VIDLAKSITPSLQEIASTPGSAAVLLSFVDRFPLDRHKRSLEEGVIYHVPFVILSFNNPIPTTNLTFAKIGNYPRIAGALTRLDQQWSTCAKGIHVLAPSVHRTDNHHLNS